MFKELNPMQYLAIDIANNYGLDKETYENRISWVKENINYLEEYQNKAEEPILYVRAVKALRNVQAGKPVGHTVALDAVCSGLQIMSALMKCKSGAEMTGLINPDVRPDAYTEITKRMQQRLGSDVQVTRKQAKEAVMTAFYGSQAVPERVFPEPEALNTFYQTLESDCKGAWELLQILLNSWDKKALSHSWYLPDGHYAHCPVMESVAKRITMSDWDYTPTAIMRENVALKYGLSNAANVIHSIDAYILRSLVRRCNYNPKLIKQVKQALLNSVDDFNETNELNIRWFKTRMADIAHLDVITNKANELDKELKNELIRIFDMVLSHEPFDIICIHDSFATHPNHCNQLRFHYKEILAELSDSTVIDDICNQLYGDDDTIDKGESISHLIRQSNYAIC